MNQRNSSSLKAFEDRLAEIGPVEPGEDFLGRGLHAIDSAGLPHSRGRAVRLLAGALAFSMLAAIGFNTLVVPEAETNGPETGRVASVYGQISPHDSRTLPPAAEADVADAGSQTAFSLEDRYVSQCRGCHVSGVEGTPRIESAEKMREVILEYLQRSGVCESCGDNEIEQAVDAWMPGREFG